MRKLAAVLALVMAAVLVPAAPAAAALPDDLAHVGNAKQLIVVTGNGGWKSTKATVRAYQRGSDGKWRQVFGAMTARIGYGGWVWASNRVQDTGTTPAGTFTITQAFGVRADPGTRLPYRKVDKNDYWVGDARDAKTYNLFQPSASAKRTWRKSQAERLAAYPTQYAYAAVINFNKPGGRHWDAKRKQYVASKPANTKRGSAIFLHASGKGATAGCVSVSRANMVRLLKWLNPAKHPRIVMAPKSAINRA
ncbi:L,D-peptidoglycan transpeptidase YkuD (ErfK/YbiS/YcfS/YnhG family) [Actinoplanes lutulentus]|uniref:L,D-peptidoglycan transpeptidase YkuD (ErfK/YbiS/YcfS/YnhG family) n=1 Tax=Actinoplanes lutulentus TaxID=1287878 RepID=A0A327ZK40_9ACTN|nr:L,D-transpeptidase family protein [Actinoplanes lutulentus]MBB2940712.1 L,D-peptidoglycan transpeptidase YkuD (ErfK/YbiS/YcfS/YnhG family) [Actinoplanes lutulentus]RAK43023.1 L,D-peptidoglycan transpeptidase YkuD (ErfK/YbiS/YcfS/YnhG family) [Actinoplanes lutulentus]